MKMLSNRLKNIKIAVDIDDTIYPARKYLLDYIHQNIDCNFKNSDWKTYDIFHVFEDKNEQLIDFFRKHFSYNNLKNNLPLKGASDFLSMFSPSNIYYVTARDNFFFQDPIAESINYLKRHNFPVLDENLILQKDPRFDGKKKQKHEILQDNNIDVFFEDNLKNALFASNYCKVFLIDYPNNRDIPMNSVNDFNRKNIHRIGRMSDGFYEWVANPWQDVMELYLSGNFEKMFVYQKFS